MSKTSAEEIRYLKGVGPKFEKRLNNLGIYSLKDLFYYFPRDYEDRGDFKEIRFIRPGQAVSIQAEVLNKELIRRGRYKSIFKVTFSDGTDTVICTWFNQAYLKDVFEKGKKFNLYGELNENSYHQYNKKEIVNPVYEEIEEDSPTIHTGRVVPIYPLTEGITQKRIRYIIYQALQKYLKNIDDFLPDYIIDKHNYIEIRNAIFNMHFPQDRKTFVQARNRLAFQELFLFQIAMLKRKKDYRKQKGIKHSQTAGLIDDFLNQLHFDLTDAQKNVWQQIKADMENKHPMQRLLQGDVGSGKTIVAVMSLIKTIESGYQGILMAPTEILAEQHYIKIKKILKNFDYNIELLIGSIKGEKREEITDKIKNSESDLIIGTHALFQKDIDYSNIGLIVIDEQHRFGVEQRYQLKQKGDNPDLLVMTATPIPRSLALTLYGDLDLSIIDEMPPGRKPVITTWRTEKSRGKIYNFVKDKIDEGEQVYVVCPLIEPSEDLDAYSVEEVKKMLEETYLSNYIIKAMHGQLSNDEKNKIMSDFVNQKIDVLISTTVIEVGVDVKTANVMVIENAERFGLAQLHQLRGRVGRSASQAYCIMIANPKTEEAKKRLEVMSETNDGFKISEADLEIRGPGEFFGTKQHGVTDLQVADILKDTKILAKANREANELTNQKDWALKYDKLAEKLKELEIII
ncbi:MAG TPA: ATP-dependent DNA helicase RecG [Halanaerobiales bacterium]|nr:ATP-dependent DNA helicase RecG [Halanaerobiales bacterium]